MEPTPLPLQPARRARPHHSRITPSASTPNVYIIR